MSNFADAQTLRCHPFFSKQAFQPTPQPAPPQMGGVDPNAPAQGDPNAMPQAASQSGMPQIDEQTAQMLMSGQLPPGMDPSTADQLLAQLQGGVPQQGGGDPSAQQASQIDPAQMMQLLEQQNQQIQSLTDGMVGVMNTVKDLDGKFNDMFDGVQLQKGSAPQHKAAADERTLIEQAIPAVGAGAAAVGGGMLGGKVLANIPMALLRALGGKRGFKKFQRLEAPGFGERAVENFKHLYGAPMGGRNMSEAALSHLTGLTSAGLAGTSAYKGLDNLFKTEKPVERITNPDFLQGLFS